ncbi:MAG: DHHW family protein [Oscillospiraceae bacterium]|nr:DHHW family protein [Oscillospiraceae bacterium]
MKNKLPQIINVAAFILVISAISFALLFMPRTEVSLTEQRELEKLPVFSWELLLSGEFTRQINIYFSDTVPERDRLTAIASFINGMSGVSIDGVTLHNVEFSDKADDIPAIELEPETSDENPPIEVEPEVENTETAVIETVTGEPPEFVTDDSSAVTGDSPEGWDGVIEESVTGDSPADGVVDIANNGILVYQNRGLMLYGGSFAMGERYAAAVNVYRQLLDNSVNIYTMVIPTAVEFYCPGNYRHLSGDQRANINHIHSNLNPGVIPVNAYSALSARVNEDIYLRTDHHWAPLGAYYATEEFANTAGVSFTPLSDYERVVVPDYVGTMYGYSGDIKIKNNPEDFVYFKPPNSYTTTYYNYDNPEVPIPSSLFVSQPTSMSYSIFMGGDAKITHIVTDVGNGRKLAIFKDSYGNALVPFMVGSFEEIFVIDIRYFPYNAPAYLKENGITDVLFANNIFAANTSGMIGYIEQLTVDS